MTGISETDGLKDLELGIEGFVLKREDAPYLPGRRSDAWIKVKCGHRREFVVDAAGRDECADDLVPRPVAAKLRGPPVVEELPAEVVGAGGRVKFPCPVVELTLAEIYEGLPALET